MDKGLRKVRARIKQRQKEQKRETKRNIGQENKELPLLFSDEEKHGFPLPMYDRTDTPSLTSKKPNSYFNSFRQAVFSAVLFIAFIVLFKTTLIPSPYVKEMAQDALTEDFPFAKVHHWYVETLGAPLAFTPKPQVDQSNNLAESTFPIHGEVMETFATNGTGIMISPDEEAKVRAWKQGIVIFSGNDKATKQTLIIQHPDGSKTTYGLLSDIDVHLYQFVQADEIIGTFSPSEEEDVAYFAIEKDKQFIDPAQVIPVDDVR